MGRMGGVAGELSGKEAAAGGGVMWSPDGGGGLVRGVDVVGAGYGERPALAGVAASCVCRVGYMALWWVGRVEGPVSTCTGCTGWKRGGNGVGVTKCGGERVA